MEEKSYICLQPTYMNEFRCNGSLCRSKCCRDWLITIDGNSYQRYCGIQPKEERKRITSKFRWGQHGNKKILAVKLRKDGSCPFLREDYFCELQKKYGEHFLSMTCATYPRIIFHLDGMMERGLTMSCPVAAKLILLQENPMEFEQVELSEERPMSSISWNPKKFPLGEHLIDLQYGCISLLQNRKLTLDQRLILMGFFLEQAEELAGQGREDGVHALAEGFASDQVAEQSAEFAGAISLHTEDYLRCMFGMVEALYGKGNRVREKQDQKYLDVLTDLYQFSKEREIVPLSKILEIYESYRESAKQMVRDFSHIFENCMVNEFFIGLYPFRIQGSLRENYINFLMSYKMMEFFALALAVVRSQEPQKDVLVEGLSFFAERADHSSAYRAHISKEIRRYRKDMAFFMRTLLDGRS